MLDSKKQGVSVEECESWNVNIFLEVQIKRMLMYAEKVISVNFKSCNIL